jgi:hypothetical protein
MDLGVLLAMALWTVAGGLRTVSSFLGPREVVSARSVGVGRHSKKMRSCTKGDWRAEKVVCVGGNRDKRRESQRRRRCADGTWTGARSK